MKFTLDWLRTHLDTDAPLDRIAETLTALGLEVESVRDPAADLADFVVAHVTAAEPHPDADKLQVCTVDAGAGEVRVVCGAPNARAGMKGVFAAPGMTVPGTGMTLKKAKIRGVESAGMLCSARELGLGEDHAGIIELPDDAPVGAPFAPSLGLDDPLFDIAITPNRPDCLGVRGIARDLAAAGLGVLKPHPVDPVAGSFESPVGLRLDFDAATASACPYFAGRLIRGVTNGPSPDWLQERLRAIGLRPISVLVDLTNFFTYDLCRPLHVFDAGTLAGSLHVRLARAGESLTALDGKTYALDGEMTVIADDDGALALGGVMGGESSGCTEATTDVFVESAYFDPIRTAATGRKLGIESDARFRFERGIDPASCAPGLDAVTRMILDLCGGEASAPVIAGADPDPRRALTLRLPRVHALGGLDIAEAEARRILDDLGFAPEGDAAALRVTVPSWRPDIDGEADLVEEVVRVAGYESVPAAPLPPVATLTRPALDAGQRRRGFVRRALAARGMVEAVTWSFMAAGDADLFGGVPATLRLANPISADLDVMRPAILPNLIAAAGRNAARGAADAALFEIGPQYAEDSQEGQATVAAGLRWGAVGPRHWTAASKNRTARPVDLFDAKADALAGLAAAGAPTDKLQVTVDAPDWYHPGRSGCLRLGPKNLLARFGDIHPRVLRAMDVEGPVVGFELFLDAVPLPKPKADRTRPPFDPSPFQPVERDFAFLLDADMPAETVLRAAAGADKALIDGVRVFDVYEGAGVEPGKKSLAISVILQPRDATLTEAEIDAVAARVVAAVVKATGGALRG